MYFLPSSSPKRLRDSAEDENIDEVFVISLVLMNSKQNLALKLISRLERIRLRKIVE